MNAAAAACVLEVLRHLKGVLRAVEKWVTAETGVVPVEDGKTTTDRQAR